MLLAAVACPNIWKTWASDKTAATMLPRSSRCRCCWTLPRVAAAGDIVSSGKALCCSIGPSLKCSPQEETALALQLPGKGPLGWDGPPLHPTSASRQRKVTTLGAALRSATTAASLHQTASSLALHPKPLSQPSPLRRPPSPGRGLGSC